jgi:hypothetical protein
MTNKLNFLIGLIAVVLGALFVWLYDSEALPRNIVLLCGIAFIIPALTSLVALALLWRRDGMVTAMRVVQMVCGLGGLGLGVCIILLPDVFRALLVYPFALLMLIGGAYQIYLLSNSQRTVNFSAWLCVAPILILVAGVLLLCLSWMDVEVAEHVVVLITGLAAVVFGANAITIAVIAYKNRSKSLGVGVISTDVASGSNAANDGGDDDAANGGDAASDAIS